MGTSIYYLDLVTSQYQGQPLMTGWLTANLQVLEDVATCIASFASAFDVDQAVGAQLDIIGSVVGQARTVGFQPSGGISPILNDATYRVLLKARVAQNHWNGQLTTLQAVWGSLFPGGRLVITDTQNMAATVILSGVFTSILQDLITHGYIVPRPQGTLYTYVFPTLPVLGFDENNSFVAGWDTGHFG